ncbi:hypothetical protein EGJ57_23645 [Brucella anthropi]|nr:hypothetical protein EGJ57_23645 [Brucella anthropi]
MPAQWVEPYEGMIEKFPAALQARLKIGGRAPLVLVDQAFPEKYSAFDNLFCSLLIVRGNEERVTETQCCTKFLNAQATIFPWNSIETYIFFSHLVS